MSKFTSSKPQFADYGQRCRICGKNKFYHQFPKNTSYKNGLSTECKTCYNERMREHRKHAALKRQTMIEERRNLILELKAVGCTLCDETEPCCLHFHHLNPDDKIQTISEAIGSMKDDDLFKAELSKCIIVCANCHAKIHNGIINLSQ